MVLIADGVQDKANYIEEDIWEEEGCMGMHEALASEKLRSFYFVNALL